MIKIKIKMVGCALMLLAGTTACEKDYLEYDYVIDGSLEAEQVWASDTHARGFLNDAYKGVGTSIDRYDFNSEIGLSAGTDDAVSSNLGSYTNILNNGSWGPTRTIDEEYSSNYGYLRSVNLFLENAPGSAIFPATDTTSMLGEAFFLRAFYHFELMKRYGKVILATRSFTLAENLDLPRNSIAEVVTQIVKDCDMAAARLAPTTMADQDNTDKGRATKVAALALKARALLYGASPLNSANDPAKWQAAADAAKVVMDIAEANSGKLGLVTFNLLPSIWNYGSTTTRFNKEVIFAAQTINTATIDNNNTPPSYSSGSGRTNPTQELVDAFEVKSTGKLPVLNTVTGTVNPSSGYTPSNPYNNRDTRFAMFINHHGKTFRGSAINILPGAKDNNPTHVNRITQTGYYVGKFMHTATGASRKAWIHMRYAEVLLNYAEALNEVQGPVAGVLDALNQVRRRPGSTAAQMMVALQTTNPALPGYVEPTKEALRARIQNERRVELCFEDHRFFDIRRWKLYGEQPVNYPVVGMSVTGTTANPVYNRFVVTTRVFRPEMYLFPIPQSQLNITENLDQNPGWN